MCCGPSGSIIIDSFAPGTGDLAEHEGPFDDGFVRRRAVGSLDSQSQRATNPSKDERRVNCVAGLPRH